MTRNSEDCSFHSPDHPSCASNDVDGQGRGADGALQKQPASLSSEFICNELRRANVFDFPADLHLEFIPGNPNRIDCLSRVHFRLLAGNRTFCRLTIARNLLPLWERTQAFAQACPEIACRPLFLHRSGEWDYLAVEFFDGRDLEQLVLEGRLTPAEAISQAGKIVAALERTAQPSTVEIAAQEIDLLLAQAGSLPVFTEFDQSFLRQTVFPLVRTGALAGPYRTRWTNGDFIPRNVLVDQQGNARLVDYEFASRTHFFAEERWRWHIFSRLPPEARNLPGLGNISAEEPWLEAFFLLRQLVLAHEVNGPRLAAADSRPAIDRLAVLAAGIHPQFRSSAFLQRLSRACRPEEPAQQKDRVIAETLMLSRAVVGDAREELTRLRDLLYQRGEKIRMMQASFSWRVTAPLRALRRMFLDPCRAKPSSPPDPARLPAVNFPYSPHDFEDAPPGLRHGIDHPHSWDTVARHVQVQGWCFMADHVRINAVRARMGSQVFTGIYGQPRPQIGGQHAQFPQAQCSGFTIDITLDPNSRHLVVEAGDEDGNWHRILTRRLGQGAFDDDYARWIRDYDTLTHEATARIRENLQGRKQRPLISVLMPVYNTPEKWLARAIESVRMQIYDHWELCIADDASTAPHIRPLLEEAARHDARIMVVFREKNGHISAASNSALELATGDFIALLDHDDEIRPHALAHVALELDRFPEADLLYSDEDKLDANGHRCLPYFKPDWNPDLFLAQNFICHLGIYRTALVRKVGGFRAGCEGSQDWDLAMRVIECSPAHHIRHIPRILYHWRIVQGSTAMAVSEKKYAVTAAQKTLADHFDRTGVRATLAPAGHHWRVQYPLPSPAPRVTLIIPTRNGKRLLHACVTSILKKTTHPNYEILVVDNESDEPETLAYLDELRGHPRCRVAAFAGNFNFSALNNFAVGQTDAPLVGLLNNDLEVINGDWLDEMAAHALRPGIGCVGAKLYYPDGRIQHAGLILGIGGIAGHAWHGHPGTTHGSGHRAILQQNFSAVTAACLVIRRETYLKAGGLDEKNFQVALNDVDFCLKVHAAGYWNLWTPFAELYHHESASRGYEDTTEKHARFQAEKECLQKKWNALLFNDPAYNPNLTLDGVDFGLAFPPRLPALGEPGTA